MRPQSSKIDAIRRAAATRRAAAASVATLLAFGATACAGGASTPAAGSGTSAAAATPLPTVTGPVTITYDEVDSSGTLKSTLATVVANFQKANPDITVKLDVYSNYTALQTADTAKLAAHNAPTMAQAYESWAATYAATNSIVPISTLAGTSDPAELDTFYAGVKKDLYLPDGKLSMWPVGKSVQVFFYNKNLYSADGLTVPSTWSDFATDAKAVSKGGVTAMTVNPNSDAETMLEILANANGTPMYDAKGAPQFTSPAAIAAAQYILNLKSSGALAVGSNAPGSYPGEDALLGQKGMFDLSSTAGYYYEQSKTFTTGAMPLPTGSAGSATEMAGANDVVFSSATEQQQAAAWTFLQYFASPAVQALWSSGTGYLPATAQALTDPAMAAFVSQNPWVTAAAGSLATAFVDPPYQWVTACGTDLENAMGAMLSNGTAPSAALGTAQSACQATETADQ
ncbi:MAG TPA: extracellular solute-binding protein [Actinocrinis sp.]|nr:extracellular solute-binding protein [Actinocrinis sp.]